jgi:L-methionine (R)-S-oxide reductase
VPQTPFPLLLEQVRALLAAAETREERLRRLCHLLRDSVPHYAWVGFYLAVPERRELVLGPFAGEPTEHVRIPYGRGICGQAAEREAPFVVQDVSKESNYLACSTKVKAEIVLPVFKDGRFVAELDIDSHKRAPFTPEDREFLEEICREVAALF